MACVNVSHRGLPDSVWRNILQFIPGPQQSLSLRAAQRALQIWVEEDAATIVGLRAFLYDFAHVGDKFGPAFFFDSIDENMKDFLQPIARQHCGWSNGEPMVLLGRLSSSLLESIYGIAISPGRPYTRRIATAQDLDAEMAHVFQKDRDHISPERLPSLRVLWSTLRWVVRLMLRRMHFMFMYFEKEGTHFVQNGLTIATSATLSRKKPLQPSTIAIAPVCLDGHCFYYFSIGAG